MDWASIRHWASVAIVIIIGLRLIRTIIAVIKRKERWTQLLFPGLIATELLRFGRGSTGRSISIASVAVMELMLVCGCVFAVLRSRGTNGLPPEQKIYGIVRLFLPTKLSSLMTQELMILAASVRLYRGPTRDKRPESKSYGYVQASPLRFLPFILIVVSIPEALSAHFILKHHPVISGALIFLTVWSVLWATGLYFTMRDRPHILSRGMLRLQMGMRRSCEVPLSDISATRRIDPYSSGAKPQDCGDFTVKHCERVEIMLLRPALVTDLDGTSCRVNRLWVTADDVNALTSALNV